MAKKSKKALSSKKVKFRQGFDTRKLSQHIMKRMIFDLPWHILHFQLQSKHQDEIFSHITQYAYEELTIAWSDKITSCQMLTSTCFTHLKVLRLQNNQIASIQSLIFIDCPQLSELDLHLNMIAQIGSLKKLLPKIKSLTIYHNLIQQNNAYQYLHCPNPQERTQWFILQRMRSQYQSVRQSMQKYFNTESITFLSKLQCKKIHPKFKKELQLRYGDFLKQPVKIEGFEEDNKINEDLIRQGKVVQALLRNFHLEQAEQ